MEITACGEEHWIWKAGWPQPREEEKGKGGVDVNGGQDENLAKAEEEEEQP